jgi:tRNA nucleotidyltransferase (CCA-adding enzyme)
VRFGFSLEPQTETYIRYAINSGVYDRTSQENSKTPALQTRLKTELKYILAADYWQSALELLDNLGALQCIHPTLKLDVELSRQLDLLKHCLRKFDKKQTLINWQMRLEVLIAYLQPEYRGKVAKNLQLVDDSIVRLEKLSQIQAEIITLLPTFEKPSQTIYLLKRYDLQTLILIALQSPRKIRRRIWQYLTNWGNIQPLLNGNDLKQLGYKPSPQYKQMLDDLLTATVDGIIKDKAEAQEFLTKHYYCLNQDLED